MHRAMHCAMHRSMHMRDVYVGARCGETGSRFSFSPVEVSFGRECPLLALAAPGDSLEIELSGGGQELHLKDVALRAFVQICSLPNLLAVIDLELRRTHVGRAGPHGSLGSRPRPERPDVPVWEAQSPSPRPGSAPPRPGPLRLPRSEHSV